MPARRARAYASRAIHPAAVGSAPRRLVSTSVTVFALNNCRYGWPGATTLWHMIARHACEFARIKPPTRNRSSRQHSSLPPRRTAEPCARIPDHLFMPTKRKVVAVIDDNLRILGAMSRLLSAFGYDTELYASAKEFLDAAMTTEAICIIVDIELGESCGIEVAQHLANTGFTMPIIFMTADNNESIKRRAMEIGCVAFLPKPFSMDVLMEALVNISPSL